MSGKSLSRSACSLIVSPMSAPLRRLPKLVCYAGCLIVLAAIVPTAKGADPATSPTNFALLGHARSKLSVHPGVVYRGLVSVVDGRTLFYPASGQWVRLAQIDTCTIPQFLFYPRSPLQTKARDQRSPLPCGALAKAWLERLVGGRSVECFALDHGSDNLAQGRCLVAGRDIALDMLRVGLARVSSPSPVPPSYLLYQSHAMSAGYGIWAVMSACHEKWCGHAGRAPRLHSAAEERRPPYGSDSGKPNHQRRPERSDRSGRMENPPTVLCSRLDRCDRSDQ